MRSRLFLIFGGRISVDKGLINSDNKKRYGPRDTRAGVKWLQGRLRRSYELSLPVGPARGGIDAASIPRFL